MDRETLHILILHFAKVKSEMKILTFKLMWVKWPIQFYLELCNSTIIKYKNKYFFLNVQWDAFYLVPYFKYIAINIQVQIFIIQAFYNTTESLQPWWVLHKIFEECELGQLRRQS